MTFNPTHAYANAVRAYQAGHFSEAEHQLSLLLQQVKNAEAEHLLGVIYYQTERFAEAVTFLQHAYQSAPRNLNYLNNYALALRANQQLDEALKLLQQAILIAPKDLDIQLNIANLLFTLERFEEAAQYYRRLSRLQPQQAELRDALVQALTQAGNHAHAHGHYSKAESAFLEATQLKPNDATLFYNLGNAERELKKTQNAKQHYLKALQLAPHDADIYNNLGNVQRECGEINLAIESYEKALQHDPNLYHAKVHLIHQKQHICNWENLEESISEVKNWVETTPAAQVSPFAFLAMPGIDAKSQLKCANHWVMNRFSALIKEKKSLKFDKKIDTNKAKLKIAYLSADFRLHPLAFLISELIELHDRTRFEIIAYSFGADDKSPSRARLIKAFDQFNDIRGLSEIEVAKKIHAEKIDILVDLTGFTQTSRSGIVALKPAHLHISWLGFPGTMGYLPNAQSEEEAKPLFEYILTDAFICPPDTQAHYAENFAYLPCYQPNDRKRPVGATPTRTDCGLPEHAFVYCCFNQSFKITQEIFNAWMRILHNTPNSVLWLLECNPWATQNLRAKAEQLGINPTRLIFAPRVAIEKHLARHAHADLFLDTTPYNAHTTCSDALWMNVPVLTLVGETFSSRVAGSLCHALNLTELMTYQLQDYENKAIYYYNNPDKLLKIKQKIIQEKDSASVLFDTENFTKQLEKVYADLWCKLIAN
jgi:predicted O-linked N-acetylglucosamine transferase (SPINDLY family)